MKEISARRIDYLHFKRTFVNKKKKKNYNNNIVFEIFRIIKNVSAKRVFLV